MLLVGQDLKHPSSAKLRAIVSNKVGYSGSFCVGVDGPKTRRRHSGHG